MASHQELQIEWMMLDSNQNNWTLEDLQVAAELGRTLLERNEELENDVKSQQAIIDDQAQEIEFLSKQNNAMKEENVTRAKFYEQLEATVFELERTNTTLTRKHDSDRKRIQSLCENIDYLERKCEEMSGTLATIRDESKKHPAGKISRNSYWSSNGSDSSEDDSFFFYKRRSHSLHDLRDYTPSPDEFDTHNSNSPDLKTSEMEFIESLESKIEELISSKKKELEKVHHMETQMRILLQENANLQEQLNEVQNEKEEEIHELRKQLLDTSNYAQQTLSLSTRLSLQARHHHGRDNCHGASSESSSPLSLSSLPETSPGCSSSSRSSNSSTKSNPSDPDDLKGLSSKNSSPAFSDYLTPAGRTNVLCKRCSAEINLLSLVNSIEVENDDGDNMEFSSLEHELARATGTHTMDPFGDKRSPNYPNAEGSGRFHNWGLKRPSLLDYFLFGRDEEIGEEATETEVDGAVLSTMSSSKARRQNEEDDEDPCLRKDRQSEKQEGKGSVKKNGCDSTSSQIPVKKLKLPVKIPFDEEVEESRRGSPGSCSSSSDTHRWDQCDIKCSSNVPTTSSETGDESVTSCMDSKSSKSASKPSKSKQKTGFVRGADAEKVDSEKVLPEDATVLPPVSVYLTPPSENEEMDEEDEIVAATLLMQELENSPFLSSNHLLDKTLDEHLEWQSKQQQQQQQPGGNSNVPEYKQILLKMFNLFHNSRRTYPVPVYPFIAQARR